MKLDFIKQIMSEFDQSNVTKMKVEIDDLKIELEKESEKVFNRRRNSTAQCRPRR